MIITSKRLDLIPFTVEFMRASHAGNRDAAERILGARLPDVWPDSPSMLELRLKQLSADPALEPWLARAMVLRSAPLMVGQIGYHGPPGDKSLRGYAPNGAEFGYTVFAPYRRRGYAREASLALMEWAYRTHGITDFIVTIDPNNHASQSLAARLGFVKVGTHIDEVDGLEDVLKLTLPSATGPVTSIAGAQTDA